MNTDKHDVSFPLAVWLAHDDYDYDNRGNAVSTTSLIKPLRQLILKIREQSNKVEFDITDMLKAKIGSAIHAVNEIAWTEKHTILKALLIKQEDPELIKRFRVNGKFITGKTVDDPIDIWLEQRTEKAINDFIITGKYDLVWFGRLSDIKSTSTYTYEKKTKDQDFILQGSIYRWLNPDKITDDFVNIEYIFTDWNERNLAKDGYPQSPVLQVSLPLMSLKDTENYIVSKLNALVEGLMLQDVDLPRCSEHDLWITEEVWQYFSKVGNTRASKNFDKRNNKNPKLAAETHMGQKGGVGEVRKKPQKAKACGYCAVAHVCSQFRELLSNGLV